MKKLFTICALLICVITNAQNFVWAKRIGSTGYDYATAISTTTNGDVVVGGAFNGTVDFDPGVGTTTLTSAGSDDIYIAKYTGAGIFVWAKRIGNASQNAMFDLKTDNSGNVYITGGFSGSIDFNPSAVTNSLTSIGLSDIYVAKYDMNGNYLWAKSMGGTGNDWAQAIDVDNTGAAYTTGLFSGGAADFNPAAATATVLTYGARDVFISKLDASGNYVWARGMGGTGDDYGTSIKVANGIVHTAGSFSLTASLSGNVGVTATFTAVGQNDIFVSKLDASSGLYIRTRTFGGTLSESANSITVDAAGNSYLTGNFKGSCDFDPSAGVVALGAIGSNGDGFISKIDGNLLYLWAKQFSGLDEATGDKIVLDSDENILSSGRFYGTVDFDPSTTATYTVTDEGNSNYDAYVHKLDPSGNFMWVKNWGNANSVYVSSMALDLYNNIYTCGDFFGTCDFDPSSTANFSLTASAFTDAYIHKLSCTLPSSVTTVSNLSSVCIGSSASRTIALSSSNELGVTYSWSSIGASGVSFSPTTGTTTSISFTSTASFSIVVTGTNACGTTTTMVQTFSPNPLPTLSISIAPSPTICSGDPAAFTASGASSYTWNPAYVINGSPTVHTSGGIFTVTATDANSCVNTKTVSFTVINNPTIAVTGQSVVCLNSTNILTASGANTYTWIPGSIASSTINAQPSSNTTYTVNAKDINGCSGSTTFSVNILSPMPPDICEVTVDTFSIYNHIIWDKTQYAYADSFIVYREVSTNVYKRIGAQDKNALSLFIDTTRSVGPANGDPNITSYRYKLQLLDSCGNYSALGPYHNSIYFLTNSSGSFFWNMYNIEGQPITPVSTFDLIRDNNATGTWTVVGSCAGTQTSLNDPSYSSFTNAVYRVHANGFNCSPIAKTAQQIIKSKSNVKNNFNIIPTGIKVNTLNTNVSIAPNPATNQLTVVFTSAITNVTKIVVTDVLGKTMYNSEIQEGNSVTIPVNDLANGVYFVKIEQGKNYTVKKFIKE